MYIIAFPVVLDHGEGMYLYDADGKEYLDFAAGFAVSGLWIRQQRACPDIKGSELTSCITPPIFITTKAAERQQGN